MASENPLALLGAKRMHHVYAAGLHGSTPSVPVSYEELKAKAKAKMKGEAFDYVSGGAGSEETVRANGNSFTKWRIVPRMLRDVSARARGPTARSAQAPEDHGNRDPMERRWMETEP